jgi:hypothetical protein
MGINRVIMVMTKECGLRQEKERKTMKKHVNGAMFLTEWATSVNFSHYWANTGGN